MFSVSAIFRAYGPGAIVEQLQWEREFSGLKGGCDHSCEIRLIQKTQVLGKVRRSGVYVILTYA